MDRPNLSVRILSPEEIAIFGIEPCLINWGVFVDNVPAACFQAELEPGGWLNVHANVRRRHLHPGLTYAYARTFSDQLLDLGARGLRCEIKNENRAAIRVALAAGFQIASRNDTFTNLVKYGKQNEGGTSAVSEHND